VFVVEDESNLDKQKFDISRFHTRSESSFRLQKSLSERLSIVGCTEIFLPVALLEFLKFPLICYFLVIPRRSNNNNNNNDDANDTCRSGDSPFSTRKFDLL